MTLLEAKDYRNWLLFKKFAVVLGKVSDAEAIRWMDNLHEK